MLTIKSPIKLRCRFPIETMHRDLSEKIMGNYTLLNDYVRKEELLYVTTQAPEVYFAEGNNISILNDIKTENRHELRLDVINNLINRILLSGTENFSYQDTVYISNVLRKFGITDVSNFMKQVYRLQEETRENRQLIDVYEEQKNVLMQLFQAESQVQSNGTREQAEDSAQVSNKYYIHEEIYNRLHTGKIYEEFKNFTQGIESNTKRIYNTEVAVSEQMSLIQNFNLHNLKKEILNQEEPIYYYHANQYELVEQEEVVGEQPEGRVSAAVLLNLVDQIYALRVNQLEQNSHRWYTVANALFQTAENTWKRYETNHKEGKTVYADMYQTMVSVVQNKQNERNMINHIIEEVRAINTQEIDEETVMYGDTVVQRQEQQQVTQQVQNMHQNQEHMYAHLHIEHLQLQQNENMQQEQHLAEVTNQYQQMVQNEMQTVRNSMTELQEQVTNATQQNYHSEISRNQIEHIMQDTQHLEQNSTINVEDNLQNTINDVQVLHGQITELQQTQQDFHSRQNQYSEVQQNIQNVSTSEMQLHQNETDIQITEFQHNQQMINNEPANIPDHITQLMEAGTVYNEQNQNIEVSNQHIDATIHMTHAEALQEVSEEENQFIQEQRVNQEYVTKQEQLRLQQDLRNVELNQQNMEKYVNVLNQTTEQAQYHTEQNHYEQITELAHLEQLEEAQATEQREELTEQTLRQFDEINKKNIENYKKILEIQKQRPKQINASLNKEKARRDALRALDNPEQVLQEIMHTEVTDVHDEINQQLDEQIYNMFSEETKNIFEQVMLQRTGEVPHWHEEAQLQHLVGEELAGDVLENNTIQANNETPQEVQMRQMAEAQFAQVQTQVQNIDARVTQNIRQEEQQRHFHIQNTESIMNRQMQDNHFDEQNVQQTTELTHITERDSDMQEGLQAGAQVPVMTELIRQTREVLTKEQQTQQNTYQTNINLNQTVTNALHNQQTFLHKTETVLNQMVQRQDEEARSVEPTRLTHAMDVLSESEYEEQLPEALTREVIQTIGKQQAESGITMIQKPAITYAMNEVIRNEMQALKKLDISNVYEIHQNKDETGNNGNGMQAASKEESMAGVHEQLELQHIMKQTEIEERLVVPELTRREERRTAVGLVHKVEEQILTEELINEIKSQTVDNVREETREVNEIHSVNRTQKQINETVNRIQVNQQENIEELVKQNVKKQINQLTDQVYGKIEKKLQTERKRRGY